MLVASAIIGCRNGLRWLIGLDHEKSHGFAPYIYWTMKDNYFSSGFSRRGFASTIFATLNHFSAKTSMSVFSVVCVIFLVIPLSIFLLKLNRKGGTTSYWLAFLLLVSPQAFRCWGTDTGHSDMLNYAFVAWALLAVLDHRYRLAAVVLVLGSLSHEAVLILGVPICAAFWFLDWRDREATLAQGARAIGVLGVAVITVALLQHVFSASPQQIAQTITAGPVSDHSEWLRAGPVDPRLLGSYMIVGGFRTLGVSNCMVYSAPGAYIFPLSCFITLLIYIFIYPLTSRTGLAIFAVVCLLPMTFLSIVAIDYGRWLTFSVMNGWLATAALCLRGSASVPGAKWRWPVAALALLALIGLGSADSFASGSRIRQWGNKIYGPSMNDPAPFLPKCDPQWSAIARGLI